jgi:iron complex transport system substrate-binding protein
MFLTRLISTILILAAILTSGCGRKMEVSEGAGNRVFRDGLKRRVVIGSTPPRRIISLAPNITEILFALGLGEKVVGVTAYCDYPDEAKNKARIGDTIHPDLERLVAMNPDLVVVSTASQLESLAGKLGELSIPVYVTNPRTVREVAASILALGEVTGATARATEIATEMERRISAVESRVKNLPRLKVLYVLQTAPLITAGRNTFINDLINLAGGISISGAETADYPQFSRETVISRAPEVIIAPASHGAGVVNQDDLRRDFATTPAVKFNRIVRVNPDWVDRPGPRIIEGLEQLAQGLHPQSP